jgi:putative membrane protein
MLRSATTLSTILLAATLSLAADKDKGSLNSKDAKFLHEAAVGAMTEVELGKVAATHGSSADVKSFGERMATDHGKELTELKTLAQSKGVDLPADLDTKHRKMVDKMSQLNGAEFDKAYSKDMLDDHRKDLKDFQKQADKASDPDVKAFAAKHVPVLQEHLSLAEKLPGNASSSSDKDHSHGKSHESHGQQ